MRKKEYLKVAEVARYFSLSESTVYKLIQLEKLKGTRYGVSGAIRVKRAHVEEYERMKLEELED